MVVVSLEHSPDYLKGWLCRYLCQVRPGLYVGTINAKIRHLLWEKIDGTADCKDAVMLWSDANEQQFSFCLKGDPRRKLIDSEGIHWICVNHEITHLSFKAKTNTKKPLICHLLETGMTTKVLLEKGLLVPFVDELAIYMKEERRTIISFLSFLSAIHDIGKIHPHFQWKIGNEIQGMKIYEQLSFRHEQYGQDLIQNSDMFDMIPERLRAVVGEMVALHHQGHKTGDYYVPPGDSLQICTNTQKEVLEILYRTFPFVLSSSKWRYTNGVASILSAIINLSDWIASTHGTFSENGYEDHEEYLNSLEKQAYQFLKDNYMLYQPNESRFVKVQKDVDFFHVMQMTNPRPMQECVTKLCKHHPTGGLMIIEAPCGEGKTAAALYAASHIKGSNGFYMALPTSATSESIHEEVQMLCDQANLKLPVFNGRAWMSEKDITIDADLWLSPSRQKLFYPVAVGTVDQLIKAALMEKYGLLRLLALLGKVVIIDEMHAYDLYMQDMIEQFLKYCGMFHVPVVILSATLPSVTKGRLLSAYAGFEDRKRQYMLNGVKTEYDGKWNMQSSYPLLTMASNVDYGKIIEVTEETFPVSKKQVYQYQMVSISESYIEKISALCMDKIKDGGCLAVIVNLVDDAKELYRFLKNKVDSGTELFLLHGRNTEYQKEKASDKVKKLFGKDRSYRPKKSIVISTQILEQSMDIDFDFMCSMLAPMDLLLQRFGRYRRHGSQGTIREIVDVSDDKILIFTPENTDKHTQVYEKEIVEKTKEVLKKNSEKMLHLPEETRTLIESVYGNHQRSMKDAKKDMKAQERVIPTPKSRGFLYYEESRHLQSALDTRYSDMRTYDIAILPEEMINQLKISPSLELIKEIKKKHTVTGISEYRLKKDGTWIFSEADIPKSKLLQDTLVFQEEDGVVRGDEYQMWIDKVYGLEVNRIENKPVK